MELKNLFEKRYSVRSFQPKQVEKETIIRILEKARLAPSAVNFQPWKIYIVTQGEARGKINSAYPKKWFENAPVVAVFTGLKGQNWKRQDGKDYLMCDVTIVTDYFVLAATEEGLGTCYVGAFDADIVVEAFKLKDEDPILMVPFGYTSEDSKFKEKKRKSVDEIAVWL
ncbi:MAG: nitroreductase [Flexistipes sinusarabici]|uniref:Nitroreductase n=1 Tax=Flexistipes sinusarabici TaxID=2352 RepID=A0A5D0ML15_FLESI|nr:nitroreductase family protein [Flexistipes sinusarabici]TYB32283.1 MAG: nitroreductase [Flexistipes sinusarabici]